MANLDENLGINREDMTMDQTNLPEVRQEEEIEKKPEPDKPSNPEGSILNLINDDDLANYIMRLLRNDISDKEEAGWTDKRVYDINAYEGNKKPTNFPWINACNFPVPLTPTLIDTAHANIMASIFYDPENTVDVQGVGVEDIRKAPILAQLFNWQINKEIEAYDVWDKAVFRSLRDGTAIIKVIQSMFNNRIILDSVPVDNIYLPIDARGLQTGQTDHIIEIIGLTDGDIEERKNLKDPQTGEPIYVGLDQLPAGLRLNYSTALQARTRQMDFVSGSKLDDRQTRDLKYIAECYLTYYVKTEDGKESLPVELIVWLSPSSNRIMRKVINTTGKRPYVALIPYPRDDRFFGMSLPEKIRYIQEELDYSHNQNINAADKAIALPIFYDPLSGFDPNTSQIVPGGAYPTVGGKAPESLQYNVNPIFERQEDRYWDLAERLTGLTELFQGRSPSHTKTLGEAMLRSNRTEIRFKALYQRFEKGWSDMIDLIYLYDTIYMPREKKIAILGVNDYKTIEELFPQGMGGEYNYTFKNPPVTELEVKKAAMEQLCIGLLTNPMVQGDKGTMWKVLNRFAEVKGERNLETLVTKPPEANAISPEEAIQRAMSGQTDIIPEPSIDATNYLMRLQLFMVSDTFKSAKPEVKQTLMTLFRRVQNIAIGQLKAKLDAMTLQQGRQGQGMIQDQTATQVPEGGTPQSMEVAQ